MRLFLVGSSFNEGYDFYDEDESENEDNRHDKEGPCGFRRDRNDDGGPGGFRRDRDDEGMPGPGRGGMGRGMGRGLRMNRRGARGGPMGPGGPGGMGGPPLRGGFNKRGIKRGMGRGNGPLGKPLSSRQRMADRQSDGLCAFFMQGKCNKVIDRSNEN